MRTCRSREMAFLPRTTGKPASMQAVVPPSTLTTLAKPALMNFSQACWPRPPDLQITYSGSLLDPLRACIRTLGIELVQGNIAGDLQMDFAEFDRRANVDQFDLPAFAGKLRQLGG